jgi:uncharacterized 2Fe-2S/4Fe-4S cluster protein (DUF4445 family)
MLTDIDRVLLAGAFGNYIRPSSAIRIGLLPNVPLDRIEPVGNAAATGAEILLISEECRESAARLARRIQYIEIAHEKTAIFRTDAEPDRQASLVEGGCGMGPWAKPAVSLPSGISF